MRLVAMKLTTQLLILETTCDMLVIRTRRNFRAFSCFLRTRFLESDLQVSISRYYGNWRALASFQTVSFCQIPQEPET